MIALKKVLGWIRFDENCRCLRGPDEGNFDQSVDFSLLFSQLNTFIRSFLNPQKFSLRLGFLRCMTCDLRISIQIVTTSKDNQASRYYRLEDNH